MDINISKKVFNKSFVKYLDNDKRYLIFYGGAGSGKSFFIAQRYVYKMLSAKKFNLLVVRKTGKSNRDSTYALFKQVISKWKLSNKFKFNESDLRIKCLLNQSEIVFSGLDDVEKLKSVTFASGEATDIWIEEASEILESDFNQLNVRLRGKGIKKQITISFNPIDINHWLKKRFFDRKEPEAEVFHSTYLDNEFLDDEYKNLLESYKDTDPYYYSVYCLGNWGVLGQTVFDARAVTSRLGRLERYYRKGYFMYTYDDSKPIGQKLTNIRWINDSNGYITLYKKPDLTKYVIGGDTAGGGTDYFVGQVLDAKTGVQVAVLRHQTDEDLYTKQMYCLGQYYNNALICIENNFSSFPNKELARLGYKNMYLREKEDTIYEKRMKQYGFKTTSLTRPIIISNLVEIVREHVDLINDKDTLDEMLTFVRNAKGRPEAEEGAHDDLVMALAIAYYAKDSVLFDQEPIQMSQFDEWHLEEEKHYDYGDKLVVI